MTTAPARVAFLGLGLIGGSIARALRRAEPTLELVAWTPSGAGPAAAARQGVVFAASDPAAALDGSDLVILAGPPLAVLATLDRLGGDLRGALAAGATVTDVASTKTLVMERAAAAGVPFVGGHPMAGRDAAGYAAGDADLLAGRPWVVVEPSGADPVHRARVEWLARACGAVPMPMDAVVHDAATAAISHLPLVASAALVEAVFGGGAAAAREAAVTDAARALAGSGWRDATRLARGDAVMGAGILATNAAGIAGAARALRDALDAWIAALEAAGGPDAAALEARLAAARRAVVGEPAPGGAGER